MSTETLWARESAHGAADCATEACENTVAQHSGIRELGSVNKHHVEHGAQAAKGTGNHGVPQRQPGGRRRWELGCFQGLNPGTSRRNKDQSSPTTAIGTPCPGIRCECCQSPSYLPNRWSQHNRTSRQKLSSHRPCSITPEPGEIHCAVTPTLRRAEIDVHRPARASRRPRTSNR